MTIAPRYEAIQEARARCVPDVLAALTAIDGVRAATAELAPRIEVDEAAD